MLKYKHTPWICHEPLDNYDEVEIDIIKRAVMAACDEFATHIKALVLLKEDANVFIRVGLTITMSIASTCFDTIVGKLVMTNEEKIETMEKFTEAMLEQYKHWAAFESQ
jgi:23S rRNA maturation mini-RNase III